MTTFRSVAIFVLVGVLVASAQQSDVLFTLSINVGGTPIPLAVRRGDDAATLSTNLAAAYGLASTIIPQLTSAIQAEIDARAPKPIATLPLTVNNQAQTVDLYEGDSIPKVAQDFCISVGAATQQCVDGVAAGLNKVLEEAQAAAAPPTPEPVPEVPILYTLTINVGTNAIPLPVREGDSAEGLARGLMAAQGLPESVYTPLVQGIAAEITARAPVPPQLLFSLPITVNGGSQSVEYREGQDIPTVARDFCVSVGATTQECVNAIANAITARLQQQQADAAAQAQAEKDAAAAQAQAQAAAAAAKAAAEARPVLYSLAITIGDNAVQQPVRQGDTPAGLAQALIAAYGLPGDILPQLASLIQSEMAARAPKPLLFSLAITVDGGSRDAEVREGDNLEAVATAFCADNGMPGSAECATAVTNALAARWQEVQAERAAAASAAASPVMVVSAEEAPATLYTLSITLGNTVVPLPVKEGDSADQLARGLMAAQGLPESVYTPLVSGIQAEITARTPVPQVLFSLPVSVNGRTENVDYRQGDNVGNVSRDFCVRVGAATQECVNSIASAVTARLQ